MLPLDVRTISASLREFNQITATALGTLRNASPETRANIRGGEVFAQRLETGLENFYPNLQKRADDILKAGVSRGEVMGMLLGVGFQVASITGANPVGFAFTAANKINTLLTPTQVTSPIVRESAAMNQKAIEAILAHAKTPEENMAGSCAIIGYLVWSAINAYTEQPSPN